MVFSSTVFLFGFLPLLLGLYFLAAPKYRNYVLLVFSLVFYGWGGPAYLLLMLVVVSMDYIFAMAIDFVGDRQRIRKLCVALAVIANIGVLGYYKYTNFLIDNINHLVGTDIKYARIVLPIGISFFTFQAMSYVIDVYRKDVKAQKNPFYVMLYVALFPQLVAGPIVRYKTVENEIVNRKIGIEDFADGLERFIIGFAKKIIIANNVGALADKIFGLTSSVDMLLAWLGAIAYTLQIYFDFSAYSDMAIGLGRIFGFHFEENFNFPYIAKSVGDFWRRWHISLTTWFRDYIYIPLGGNRKGQKRMYVNMFIIWLLTGIWHGAEWNFILWGLYYFVFQALEKLFLGNLLEKIPKIIRHIYALFIIIIGWVIFRCDDGLGHLLSYMKSLFSFSITSKGVEMAQVYLNKYGIYIVLGIIFSIPFYRFLKEKIGNKVVTSKMKPVFAAGGYLFLLGLFFVSVLFLINSTYNPFIYFRF